MPTKTVDLIRLEVFRDPARGRDRDLRGSGSAGGNEAGRQVRFDDAHRADLPKGLDRWQEVVVERRLRKVCKDDGPGSLHDGARVHELARISHRVSTADAESRRPESAGWWSSESPEGA